MVTITEVARDAGVSVSTVSYVLSGKRRISAETTRRVHEAIRALSYEPNAGARALARRRSQILGLVIPEAEYLARFVGMEFGYAVTGAARARGYDVLLLTSDEGEAGLRRVATSGLADGVILMEVATDDERVRAVKRLGLPAALIGHPADAYGLPWVDLDFHRAAGVCVEHLAGLGHRRIGFLGHKSEALNRKLGYAVRTQAGSRAAARRLGVELTFRRSPRTRRAVARAVRDLLDREPRITGLVVADQEALLMVYEILRHDGVRIPQDLSVVAYALTTVAERVSSRLTYVEIPVRQLAENAANLLVDLLDKETTREVLLPPNLCLRESSAAIFAG